MRIVVLSSGLVLGVLMFIQTVLIAGLNSTVSDDDAATTDTVSVRHSPQSGRVQRTSVPAETFRKQLASGTWPAQIPASNPA